MIAQSIATGDIPYIEVCRRWIALSSDKAWIMRGTMMKDEDGKIWAIGSDNLDQLLYAMDGAKEVISD